jgi:hypothetical protein
MMAPFGPMAVETRPDRQAGLNPAESVEGRARFDCRFAGCAVKRLVVVTAVALAACGAVFYAQNLAAATQAAPTPQEQSAPVAGTAPATAGLIDLDAMTFSCPKAGLNAAAREAAKVQSQGTYQFAYFKIINDAHHASYEVHFKSNYEGEPDLKYCVSIYCQQGWDPKTTKASVTLLGTERRPMGGAAHGAACGAAPAPVQRRLKR